jgi:hypothetical protein
MKLVRHRIANNAESFIDDLPQTANSSFYKNLDGVDGVV